MATSKDFAGSWNLVSYHNESDDGTVNQPFGKKPKGMIYYDSTGHMGVNLMPEGRKQFTSGDMFRATEEEAMDAIRYISYSGSYEVLEDRVIHRIEVSLFPNWIGKNQERFFEIEGDLLTLSTKPMNFDGKKVVSRLVWKRNKI